MITLMTKMMILFIMQIPQFIRRPSPWSARMLMLSVRSLIKIGSCHELKMTCLFLLSSRCSDLKGLIFEDQILPVKESRTDPWLPNIWLAFKLLKFQNSFLLCSKYFFFWIWGFCYNAYWCFLIILSFRYSVQLWKKPKWLN